MEPKFIRMKVPKLKKFLISVANKRHKELLDLSLKAHERAIKVTSMSEAVESVWTSASSYLGRQYGLLAPSEAEYSSFEL